MHVVLRAPIQLPSCDNLEVKRRGETPAIEFGTIAGVDGYNYYYMCV